MEYGTRIILSISLPDSILICTTTDPVILAGARNRDIKFWRRCRGLIFLVSAKTNSRSFAFDLWFVFDFRLTLPSACVEVEVQGLHHSLLSLIPNVYLEQEEESYLELRGKIWLTQNNK